LNTNQNKPLILKVLTDYLTNNKRVTLKMLSDESGIPVIKVRKYLEETFKQRIIFTRGRSGGITLMPLTDDIPVPQPVSLVTIKVI